MSLTSLFVSGNAFAIGHALGRFGADAVHKHLRPLPLWQSLAARAGSPAAQAMREQVEQRFPRYWQELLGLAAGLQLPIDEVFLWNCRGDFVQQTSVDGCTSVLGPTTGGVLIAHNEDGFPQLRGHCALINVAPEEGLTFSSFCYPGSIPGHTFAVNSRGLVITVNNIRPSTIPVGLPRQILARASLDAPDIASAIEVLCHKGRAGSFHHSLGQSGTTRLVSVEATADGCHVREVIQPHGHSNHLIEPDLSSVGQRITASSGARQDCVERRLSGLRGNLDAETALRILRDTSNQDLPVYRCADDDPDDENTLATAVFLIGEGSVECRVYSAADTARADVQSIVLPT